MQTKQILITLLFCALSLVNKAQVADHFTDGDFNFNPTWIGDDSLFKVVSGELRLNGSMASDAHLVSDHTLLDSITWTFLCRFDLSPSTQNFARFYLASDQENLETALNGYYVQLGGVTGNTDSISLYRQNGALRTCIAGGRAGTVSRSINKVRIKVFRDMLGNWELYSDTTGGTAYTLEGTGFDNTITSSNYLGWYVKYTAGNNQKYYLDEVNANKAVPDVTAPEVDSIAVSSGNSISVYFNEGVAPGSSQRITNYTAAPSIGNPVSALLLASNKVMLQFAGNFVPGTNYTLSIQQVSDEAGNVMAPDQKTFSYYTPSAHDILVSEFMPDPTPTVGLPEQEFIELYNNTATPINLAGFTLSDGGTPAVLPAVTLAPDGFMIVCSPTASSFLAPFGKVVAVTNMPSLNNTGDQIMLKDNNGNIVHQITYDLSWYNDPGKDGGGYSVELDYPKQLCRGKQVYSASLNLSGGTPGKVNSSWNIQADTQAPGMASASAVHAQQLLAVFNENTDAVSFHIARIALEPAIAISSFQVISADSLLVNLQAPLTNNTSYLLRIDSIKDCSGNLANTRSQLDYYVPEKAANYDVLIHEIMADPDPAQQLPNAEYIELYNRSTRIISLENWTIGDEGGFAKLPDVTLLPDSFIVLTSSANSALFTGRTIGVSGFPSLGNDGDNLVLKNESGQVIHAISYTSAWYADGFKKQGGFSLEMIDAINPCGINNWKETSHKAGGTPGYVNSVKGSNKDKTTPRLMRAYVADSTHLQLFFSEALDSTSFTALRFVLNGNSNPLKISGTLNQYESTLLQFADTFGFGQVHSIRIDSLADCAQNLVEDYRSIDFERPYIADSGSLAINEVLFNARSNAYDFVELYNRSNKPLDIKNIIIAKRDASGGVTEMQPVFPSGFVIRPGEHAVITPDATSLMQNYFCKNPSLVIPISLPSYNDDNGVVVLMNTAGVIYDEFAYDDDMHFDLLDNKDGVSLERIDHRRPANDRTNWTSAASSVAHATPTYKNSQYLHTERSDNMLTLQPPRVSPDGDGHEDVMNINYNFNRNGYTGSLWIYDAHGRVVKQLLKNEVFGTNGTYTWDGTTENGSKASIGIYIFRMEVFNLEGEVKEHTAVGVVAGKL
ncbi:MAG: lamin tail domain-containing protein [Bacteroidota bacterium]